MFIIKSTQFEAITRLFFIVFNGNSLNINFLIRLFLECVFVLIIEFSYENSNEGKIQYVKCG